MLEISRRKNYETRHHKISRSSLPGELFRTRPLDPNAVTQEGKPRWKALSYYLGERKKAVLH